METTVELTRESISLAGLLKLAGVVDSGGRAKHVIQSGRVRVNGREETRRGTSIRQGDLVEIEGDERIRINVV